MGLLNVCFLKGIRPKISSRFWSVLRNGPFRSVSFHDFLSVHDPFIFLLISVQNMCALFVGFGSVLFSCSRLHMALHDYYTLLKSVHASQQFACGRKKDGDSLTTPIRIFLSLASHVSLKHTFCLHAYLLLFI